MAKFYGQIGYATTYERAPGVYEEKIVERPYYGDLIRSYLRNQGAQKVNDDFTLSNTITVIADPFAFDNFQRMKYVTYMNTKWKIESAEVQYPRLILQVGGVYND